MYIAWNLVEETQEILKNTTRKVFSEEELSVEILLRDVNSNILIPTRVPYPPPMKISALSRSRISLILNQ
jgi:hypothetical protein